MWGEDMIALIVGWVGECCSEPSQCSNCYSLVKHQRFRQNVPEIFRGCFSLEFSCPYGVKIGHITAGWVGECCSELDTPADIPQSDTKKGFVGMFQDAARYKWGKWQ